MSFLKKLEQGKIRSYVENGNRYFRVTGWARKSKLDQFLRNKSTGKFIQIFEDLWQGIPCYKSSNIRGNSGTWFIEELAKKYAGYLSAEFEVNFYKHATYLNNEANRIEIRRQINKQSEERKKSKKHNIDYRAEMTEVRRKLGKETPDYKYAALQEMCNKEVFGESARSFRKRTGKHIRDCMTPEQMEEMAIAEETQLLAYDLGYTEVEHRDQRRLLIQKALDRYKRKKNKGLIE